MAEDDLKTLLGAELSTDKTAVLALDTTDTKKPLWVVYSYGENFQLPQKSHLVTLFTHNNNTWQELDRISLGEEPSVLVAINPILIEPKNLWLYINGGWGAYSDCNILLRFDGDKLHKEESYCNRYKAGEIKDLDSDGVMEVVQDWTNYGVYCGACGVKFADFKVLRWNGHQFIETGLKLLDTSAPVKLQQLNNQTVTLAQAGLWKDAQTTIDKALKIDNQNPTVTWNATLINLQTDAKRKEANSFLTVLFWGDYKTILDMMRKFTIEKLFESPVELTTITEFDEGEQKKTTLDWVIRLTNSTIEYKSEFAPAYFLRGWAKYLTNPGDSEALKDIEQAVQLDPTEPLFSGSLEYLLKTSDVKLIKG